MAVYSMTGYASSQHTQEQGKTYKQSMQLGLELRSVNGRFLDLHIRLPDELRILEPQLREILTKNLKRGKVELRGFWLQKQDCEIEEIPQELLEKVANLQDSIRGKFIDAAPLSVADIINFARQTKNISTQEIEKTVITLAQEITQDLKQSRLREGERLKQILLNQLTQLKEAALQVKPLIPQIIEAQKQRFITRWNEALAGDAGSIASSNAAQDRALAEVTSFAIRIDVAEELDRLASHIAEMESILEKGGEVGKKLDFLTQELQREANTLGSKSATISVSKIAVDMKVVIEQMREQVQNLE